MSAKTLGEKNSFPPLLHLSFVLQQASDELLLDQVGIGLSQVRIMSVLSPSTPYSQRSIAVNLGQTESNVSRQLKQMKKQGLVSVTRSKKDSRQREVMLTQKGKTTYKKAEKILKSEQSRLLRLLSSNEVKAFEQAARNLTVQH